MNNVEKIIELLSSGVKISHALKEVCGNKKISIPFKDGDFDVPIEELALSTRSYNALKRSNLNVLSDIINCFSQNGWNSIKNLGRKCATEIFEKIIDFAWNNMNNTQKSDFLISIGDNEG